MCSFFHSGVNGLRVTGGNVELSSDKKTLTLELQLDGAGQQGPQGPQGGQGGQGGQGTGGGSQSGGMDRYVQGDKETQFRNPCRRRAAPFKSRFPKRPFI